VRERCIAAVVVVRALEPDKPVRRGERSNAAAAHERPALGLRAGEELLAPVIREMTGPGHDSRFPVSSGRNSAFATRALSGSFGS
jgi:hypothetical protein